MIWNASPENPLKSNMLHLKILPGKRDAKVKKNPSFSGFHHSFNLRGVFVQKFFDESMEKVRKRPHLYKRTPKWDG